jgi:WW domain-binding protein 4
MKPSDPYANYSTPASLGYTDPDAEEAQQRKEAGTPGAWTVVAKGTEGGGAVEETRTGEKRGATEAEDVRVFKLRKKTAEVGLGEIYDPSKIEPSEPVQTEPGLFRKRKGRPNGTATKLADR